MRQYLWAELTMAVCRLLFLAKYRVPHACFSMQWDHMLQGIDYTIIATPMTKDELEPVWERYQIDSANFVYRSDSEIYSAYPQVNDWVFPDDYRTYWLRQQAIKLSYLDLVGEDVMMIQDPDTFMVQPYTPYKDGRLNLMSLLNTTQGSYNGMFESITGIPRPTPHCFVTEFVPVRYRDWIALREHLQQRWPHKHWLNALIDATPSMATIPPWGNGEMIKWFAEPELLGDWAVVQGDVDYFEQRRFEYDHLEKISMFNPSLFNAVCDAVPDLRWSMQMDWNTLTIPDFDRYKAMIDHAIESGH